MKIENVTLKFHGNFVACAPLLVIDYFTSPVVATDLLKNTTNLLKPLKKISGLGKYSNYSRFMQQGQQEVFIILIKCNMF